MTTILLIGKEGQVGWELRSALVPVGRVIAVDHSQMDLCDPSAIRRTIREIKPHIIVNAAGYTTVDKAESEFQLAMSVNATAPGIIAEAARELGALLVHYSTVFVFDGTKNTPYIESDAPRPLNVYGKSKLAGEQAIIQSGARYMILRASWTYSERRTNFPLTILRLARESNELRIVEDQIGTPTSARAYAEATAQMLRATGKSSDYSGIYHLSAIGGVSRYEWARMIVSTARERCNNHNWAQLRRITTADYELPAKRPLHNVMDGSKVERVFGVRIGIWEEQFKAFLANLSNDVYTGAACPQRGFLSVSTR